MKLSLPGKLIVVAFALSFAVTFQSRAQSTDVPCDPAALVDAINTANGTPEADTLNLATNCEYVFASATDINDGFDDNALPKITTSITINGNGATIARNSPRTVIFRLFFVDSDGDLTLNNLTITGGISISGGGIRNYGTLTVTNSTLSGNNAYVLEMDSGGDGGGIRNSGTLTVIGSTLTGNNADFGGGIYNDIDSRLVVTNSTLSGNSADFGGGIYNYVDGALTVNNSVLTGNSAYDGSFGGGGIYNNAGRVTVTNSTLSGNSSGGSGGGIYSIGGNSIGGLDSMVEVSNSIIWGNNTQISTDASTILILVSYSIVEGGYRGMGNLSGDPLFVDPIPHTDAPTSEGDYRLQPGSPAIDAGSNDALPLDTHDLDCNGDTEEPVPYDRDNTARIKDDTVDIGAYEWPIETEPDADANAGKAGCKL